MDGLPITFMVVTFWEAVVNWIFRGFAHLVPELSMSPNSLPDSLRDPAVESTRFSAGLENASLCRTLETWSH